MKPGSKEWLEARRKGIGGSDAGAIAGLSPWKTPLEVYLDKIGESVNEESGDMRRGTLLEPAVRQMYADATGNEVIQPDAIITNPDYPFALVNLDGIATGKRLLECKTSRNRSEWGEDGSNEIPITYMAQVQHGLAVAKLEVADVAVLFGDFEFSIYTIEPDKEYQDLLFELEAKFWEMVQNRIPPEISSPSDVLLRWPKSKGNVVNASEEDVVVASALVSIKEQIKALERYQEAAELFLKASIKDADKIAFGSETIASWSNTEASKRFNAKLFESENPELYKKYLVETNPSRRFLLKGNAKCLSTPTITMNLESLPLSLLHLEEAMPQD